MEHLTQTKLTAATLKEIAKVKPQVAEQVRRTMRERRTRKAWLHVSPAGYRHPLGEGERLTVYAPNGRTLHTSMVSESTLGAANDGVNYHVGEQTPPLPEGTWIVSEELFLGHWHIRVRYVGQDAPLLPDGTMLRDGTPSRPALPY